MSTAFCPTHSSWGSTVMCLCIRSPLCITSRSLRICTKSCMKVMGKLGRSRQLKGRSWQSLGVRHYGVICLRQSGAGPED